MVATDLQPSGPTAPSSSAARSSDVCRRREMASRPELELFTRGRRRGQRGYYNAGFLSNLHDGGTWSGWADQPDDRDPPRRSGASYSRRTTLRRAEKPQPRRRTWRRSAGAARRFYVEVGWLIPSHNSSRANSRPRPRRRRQPPTSLNVWKTPTTTAKLPMSPTTGNRRHVPAPDTSPPPPCAHPGRETVETQREVECV